ncbi:MAG: hypothetical protein JXB85_00005, partial [Anaerolineales bacterium]|nr:hypothetical protein [Anaerolineales bacterium]
MQKRLFFPSVLLALSILACAAPGMPPPVATDPPVPGVGTETPTASDPVLPPAPELRVVYARAGNLWLWTESGGAMQLTFSGVDSSPQISSDGAVVAFQRGDELWAVNSSGGGERQLVSAAYLAGLVAPASGTGVIHWFDWQPSSHTLYFGTSQDSGAYIVPLLDLHRVDAAAGMPPVLLLAAGMGGLGTFSPDGLHLALVQSENILLLDVSSSAVLPLLSFEFVLTYSEWFYLPEVTWKADSSGLWTVIPAHDSLGDPTEPTEIWFASVAGGATLVDSFVAVPVFIDRPRLSPDGSRVMIQQEFGGSFNLLIHPVGGGGDLLILTAGGGQAGAVSWSPDSSQLVYWNPLPVNTSFGYPGAGFAFVSDLGTEARAVRWVDPLRLLFLAGSDLR